MNNIDSQKVKDCWEKIKYAKGSDVFVDHFYQTMFKNYPEARPFFPEDLSSQKSTLLATLDNVINGIDYIELLEEELLALGLRHKSMGVIKEQYTAFVHTIIEAAHFASDFSLTDKEISAWENAFRDISDVMLKAY